MLGVWNSPFGSVYTLINQWCRTTFIMIPGYHMIAVTVLKAVTEFLYTNHCVCLQACIFFVSILTLSSSFLRSWAWSDCGWSTSPVWPHTVPGLYLLDRLEPAQHWTGQQDQRSESHTHSGPPGLCDGHLGVPLITTGWLECLRIHQRPLLPPLPGRASQQLCVRLPSTLLSQ